MHIFVIGGCGFIGANLVRCLLNQGDCVQVLDNFHTGKRDYLRGLDITLVEGDVRNPETWIERLDHVDAIVHLAAQTGVPDSVNNPAQDYDVNVHGTFQALLAAKERGVKRFVFASSNAPLGNQGPVASEDRALRPLSPYGASKACGEAYCKAFYHSYRLETVALRFANVYGPFAGHKQSVVARFFKSATETGKLTILGDGHQTRDFIHVSDLITGIVLAIQADDVAGEVIQLGTGIETEIITLAHHTRQLFSNEIEIVFEPSRPGDIYRNYSNIEKARKLLGFEPQVDIAGGLKDTFDWFAEHSLLPMGVHP